MNHYVYEDISIGQKETFSVTITEAMLDKFRTITGDVNYLHTDEEFATSLGYKARISYGMLTASFLSTLAGVYLPGENSLIQQMELFFAKPVYIGDELTITGTVKEIDDKYHYMWVKVEIRNQNNEKVLRGKMQIGFLK